MRRLLAVAAGIAALAAALTAPAAQAAAPVAPAAESTDATDAIGPANDSYLFVVDADRIRVLPGAGTTARIILTGPEATRFTDRPERQAEPIRVRAMLKEFGWTAQSTRLQESTPNAAVSIAGQRSQIVDIKRARIADGRLVLHVRGLDGPLTAARGSGAVFIDNAVTFPSTQALELEDGFTATITLVSETEVTAVIEFDGGAYGPGSMSPWSPLVNIGGEVGALSFEATVQAGFTSTGVAVSVSVFYTSEGAERTLPTGIVSFTL